MDLHALALQITQEVLERLQTQSARPCVLVLDKRDPAIAARVAEALGQSMDIIFMDETGASGTPARHILPGLGCSAMADLAAGRASDKQCEQALRLLLSGVRVEVLEFEYKNFCQTAPGPLYDLYASYEKTLASYGLVQFRPAAPDSLRLREKLVTAKIVHAAGESGVRSLLISEKAIVTPLAREAANELNISIVKQI